MKILIVAPDFYPTNGGYANAIVNFVNGLSQSGAVQVFVYTPTQLGNNYELDVPNVRCFRYRVRKIFFLGTIVWELISYLKLRRILKDNDVDCVLFETAEFGILGCLLLRSFKNIAVRIHACAETETTIWGKGLYNRYHSFFIKLFLKKAKWILSTNQYHVDFYKKFFLKEDIYKIAEKKFFVIPNIIFENSINNIDNMLSLKKSYHVDGQKLLFTLGRLNLDGLLQKGIEDLIYAVCLLKNDVECNWLDRFRILVVGDGECKDRVKLLARNLGVSSSFLFIDKMSHPDVLGLLKVVDGTILLSRFEGLSMFALEALSCGSPLLFSGSGGIRDLVVDGKNGFLVESQNIESIKDGLKKIIALQEQGIEEMRGGSLGMYQKNFPPQETVNKFLSVLKILCDSQ